MEREVEISMNAHIRGGEHIMKVNNDSSLMKMFDLNTNPNQCIDLYVGNQVMVFIPRKPYAKDSNDETIKISSDEDMQSIRVDEEVLVDVQVSGIERQSVDVNHKVLVDVVVDKVDRENAVANEEVLVDVLMDKVADKTYLDDPLKPDKATESDGEFSSPTNDNDPVLGGTEMTSCEDDPYSSFEEDVDVKNDL